MLDEFTSERKSEIKRNLTVAASVLITSWFVAELFDRAWSDQGSGIGKSIIEAIFDATPFTLTSLGTLLFGVFLGFVLLVAIDVSKRIQGPTLGVVLLVEVAFLLATGRLDDVDWVAGAPFLLLGTLLAGLVGSVTYFRSGRREFPVASVGVHTFVVAFVSVSLFDVYLLNGFFSDGETLGVFTVGLAVATLVASVAFVLLIAFLVQSRDQRRIAIVSANDGTERALGTGLVKHVRDEFDADRYNLTSGRGEVMNDIGYINTGELPQEGAITEPVVLEYTTPQMLSRYVKLSAHPITATKVSSSDIRTGARGGVLDALGIRTAVDLVLGPYAELQTELFGSDRARLTASLDDADIVVFTASFVDYLAETETADGAAPSSTSGRTLLRDLEHPSYLDDMSDIDRSLGPETRTYFLLFGNEELEQMYESSAVNPATTSSDPDDFDLDAEDFREKVSDRLVPMRVDRVFVVELDEPRQTFYPAIERLREKFDTKSE